MLYDEGSKNSVRIFFEQSGFSAKIERTDAPFLKIYMLLAIIKMITHTRKNTLLSIYFS